MPSGRIIAIGDVHGCVDALDALVDVILPTPADQLVFLGDLIDQGPDSCRVFQRLAELKQRCQVVLIQGNHEEMLYAARESERALRYWENCGGVSTLNSHRFGGSLDDIPAAHWKLLAECRPFYETDKFIFAHANYLPDVSMPMQSDHQLRWELFEPEKMQPHISGKPVVVGHTEQANGEIIDLGFAACIDTACWRYGWLTAIEVSTRQTWQASRWGVLREPEEQTQRQELSQILRSTRAKGLAK
jgi:serine/threonine protein phosphatase 1